jgi:hypothetical protein
MTTLQTVQKLARQHGYSVRKLDPPSGMPPDFASEFADNIGCGVIAVVEFSP